VSARFNHHLVKPRGLGGTEEVARRHLTPSLVLAVSAQVEGTGNTAAALQLFTGHLWAAADLYFLP